MNLLKSALLIAAFVSTQSFAALQTVHWKTSGDSLATLDTVTGKEWLDLTQTDGRSIDYVMTQLSAGGLYAGWRIPTQSEVLELFNSNYATTFSTTNTSFYSASSTWTNRSGTVNSLFGLTASTGDSGNYNRYSYGMYLADSGNVNMAGVRRKNAFGEGESWWYGAIQASTTTSYSNSSYGVWLVSDGGVTFSSKQAPNLNIANPQAPINLAPNGTTTIQNMLAGTNYATITLGYENTGTSLSQTGFVFKVDGGTAQTITGNSILLSNLNAGQTYSIEYAAYNSNGTGTWKTTSITTNPPATTAVSAPALFTSVLMLFGFIRRKVKQ